MNTSNRKTQKNFNLRQFWKNKGAPPKRSNGPKNTRKRGIYGPEKNSPPLQVTLVFPGQSMDTSSSGIQLYTTQSLELIPVKKEGQVYSVSLLQNSQTNKYVYKKANSAKAQNTLESRVILPTPVSAMPSTTPMTPIGMTTGISQDVRKGEDHLYTITYIADLYRTEASPSKVVYYYLNDTQGPLLELAVPYTSSATTPGAFPGPGQRLGERPVERPVVQAQPLEGATAPRLPGNYGIKRNVESGRYSVTLPTSQNVNQWLKTYREKKEKKN